MITTFHVHAEVSKDNDDDTTIFSDYIMNLPEHIQWLLILLSLLLVGSKCCNIVWHMDKILKIGTNESLNLSKETSSFGWLLLGNRMFWSMAHVQSMVCLLCLAPQELRCLELQLHMSSWSTL